MSQLRRTPENFPKMKHRAAGRKIRQLRRTLEKNRPLFADLGEALAALTETLLAPFREYAAAVREALAAVARDTLAAAEAFPDPECPECEHIHDLENTACVCCQVLAPDPISMALPNGDVLTLRCLAAEHDRCPGDYCQCACHDHPNTDRSESS